ncbi:hypothetical protein CNR22_14110 [Sphingobacteriaceae bacterium]|nr:hypothetical protein CNR22_14110 [Sphingobacteriaceae bacterium]
MLASSAFAQKNSKQKKTSSEKDSLRVYKSLKRWAYKHKITRMAYDATFKDPEAKEYPALPASHEEKNVNPYLKYKNKMIRQINVTVFDPFGYSISDTLSHSTNGIERFGNKVHTKTRKFVIINRLLFHKNDTVDALAISETERILRQAPFINDARIVIIPLKNKDSVDVNVIVLDKFPITIPFGVSDISGFVRFQNQNLFGWGQQFQQRVGFKKPDVFEYSGSYGIANLDNTYISANADYNSNITGTSVNLGFNRGFFSPLSKWAGGVNQNYSRRYFDYVPAEDTVVKRLNLDTYTYDLWIGRSFKLSKEKSLFNQSTNILGGLRYYKTFFTQRPPRRIDSTYSFQNAAAFVGNIGFAVQQYYKEKFIYRFGANEDVPEGLILQFIYGGLKKEHEKIRYYTGFEIAKAKHYDVGYVSATFSQGVFFNRRVNNDITTNFKLNYFSDLLRNGRWFYRQFLNFNLVHGQNKLSGERLTIVPDELYGFNGTSLSGNTKMTLTSETVAYLPYNIIGFHLAPILMMGVAMLGDPVNPVLQSRLYQSYSLGIMVRNENLLSSTFQISFGLYPFTPNGRNTVFVYNPVTSFTLRVRLFEFSRPEFVSYY